MTTPLPLAEQALRSEAADFYAAFAEAAASGPAPALDPQGLRAIFPAICAAAQGGELYRAESARDVTIEADGAPISCRVIEAEQPTGLYLNFHAGGWVIGAPELDDVRMEHLAREVGLTTISVDYRLAPEHPFPAALDDGRRAARWLLTEGVEQYGSDRIFVGGQSAGANLALQAGLSLVDGPPSGSGVLCGLNLLYGAYDLTMTPSSKTPSAIVSPDLNVWLYDQYCDPGARQDPDISPLYADLSGLPPVMLTVGDVDPYIDDTLFLAARLAVAGVPHEVSILPGADHGFDEAPLGVARLARERIVAFLQAAAGSR
jgi:acetyl esterase/lipase